MLLVVQLFYLWVPELSFHFGWLPCLRARDNKIHEMIFKTTANQWIDKSIKHHNLLLTRPQARYLEGIDKCNGITFCAMAKSQFAPIMKNVIRKNTVYSKWADDEDEKKHNKLVIYTDSLAVTHLWPASFCMDGMAKKLCRECEAAISKRRG